MQMKFLHLLSLLSLQIVKTNEISYAKEKVYQLIDLDNFEFKINSGIYDYLSSTSVQKRIIGIYGQISLSLFIHNKIC